MQPFGDRSGVVIEPMLTDQWYVDAKTLAKPAVRSGSGWQDTLHPGKLVQDLLQLDGRHSALVYFPPALVGPSDSGLVWARRL